MYQSVRLKKGMKSINECIAEACEHKLTLLYEELNEVFSAPAVLSPQIVWLIVPIAQTGDTSLKTAEQ